MNESPISTREDIPKLHSETSQLRNQQFVLATVALTVVGFSTWMIPQISSGSQNGLMHAAATTVLQSLLAILFFWSVALRRLIGSISAYLKVKNASDWERDFYEFSHNKDCGHWSQTRWVARFYVALGLLLAVNYFLVALTGKHELSPWFTGAVLSTTFIYALFIWHLARIAQEHDKQVEKKWRSLIAKPAT